MVAEDSLELLAECTVNCMVHSELDPLVAYKEVSMGLLEARNIDKNWVELHRETLLVALASRTR